MAAKIHYEKDAPIAPLQGKKVAVIGYGSQGHAHGLNLRDSGIEVGVAELPGTPNFKLATEHGFKPGDIKTAMNGAALIIVTLPDEMQGRSTRRRSPRTSRPARRSASATASISTSNTSCRPRISTS